MGVRKLQLLLEREAGLKVGRDYLYLVTKDNGLMIKRKRRKTPVTDGIGVRNPENLIKGITPNGPEQIWQSDITYIALKDNRFAYLSLVSDGYSRKIMGYAVGMRQDTDLTLRALEMAIANRLYEGDIIHHSDRGSQYLSNKYVERLQMSKFRISTSAAGHPQENGKAERLNGTLKYEFGLKAKFASKDDLISKIVKTIPFYNDKRPHDACGKQTPSQVHSQYIPLKV